MNDTPREIENIAATLSRVLPKAAEVIAVPELGAQQGDTPAISYLAVPNNQKIERIDNESLLPHPRRAKGTATMGDAQSFIDYVNEFATTEEGPAVWCNFDPQSASLSFAAVLDEHSPEHAGWRGHQAVYTPRMSIEWMNWKGSNGSQKTMGQVDFAEFIEKNENDIANVEGYPTSLQMHAMATEFIARQEMAIKSTVRSMDGGVKLQYIADSDTGTVETMKVFEKFAIGIPVFWTVPQMVDGVAQPVPAYRIDARLKYRVRDGKVVFWYELIRPDRSHQLAAQELIEQIRKGIGDVPLRMGTFS